jgi:hypothetical protein
MVALDMRRRMRPLRPPLRTVDRRPPEARLAAFLAERNPERARRIFSHIRDYVTVEPAVWIGAARTLYGAGTITREVYSHFVSIFLDGVMDRLHDQDPELVRLSDEMRAIEASHGLDELESFYIDEGPPEWREASAAWDRRARAVELEYLRAHGFGDLAADVENRRDDFDAKSDAGRRVVWPDSEEFGPRY